jgi:surface polysaccharide O-acyltransferase-like enzyme
MLTPTLSGSENAMQARVVTSRNTGATAPDPHESRFISVSRLLMICGLVWHHLFELPGSAHSPRTPLQDATPFLPEFLNSFFHMAMMTAVPVLSVISGFLFFRRAELDYARVLTSRFRTVALPTWLWSAFWLGCGWAVYGIARDGAWLEAPGFGWLHYFDNAGGFDNAGAMTLASGIFAVPFEPFAFQFWFVHDLLITMLLAPLLYFFLRLFGWPLLVLMAVFWLLVPDPPLLFSGNVPMFFAVGAWMTLPQSMGLGATLSRLEHRRWLLTGLLVLALLLRIFSHAFGSFDTLLQGHVYLCVLRVLGVLAVAGQISRLVADQHASAALLERYSCYAFFIFAVHFPLIELVQVGVQQIPGYATASGMLLSWMLVPAVTISIALAMAVALEKHAPVVFRVLNGGRGSRPVSASGETPDLAGPDVARRVRPYSATRTSVRELNDPAPDTR